MTPNSYSGHYGFPGYQAGFGAPATVGAHQPFGYAGTNSFGDVHVVKREA